MYSSGLPILFLISAINFALIYWVDKYLVLRFYRTPKNYDEETIKYTLKQFNWAFLFHAIITFYMLSNTKILTSEDIKAISEQIEAFKEYSANNFGLEIALA